MIAANGNRMPEAFAPIPVAALGGSGAVLSGIAVTIGYCLTLRSKPKAT